MRRCTGMAAGVIGLLTALLLTGCSADEPSGPPDRGQNRERAEESGPGVDLGPGGEGWVPLPRIPSAPGLPGWAHQVRFAADGSGFALLAQCVEDAATPDNNFCRQYVAVLDRGGSTWPAPIAAACGARQRGHKRRPPCPGPGPCLDPGEQRQAASPHLVHGGRGQVLAGG